MRKLFLLPLLSAAVLSLQACTHSIETETTIDAQPEAVWAVLTDFAAYPEWNPFVTRIQGAAETGTHLEVRIRGCGQEGMTFTPEVLAAKAGESFRWKGHLFLPGLFDGEHGFHIRRDGSGGVRFVQRERFSGLLVPFIAGSIEESTRCGFERMNAALKARAEAPVVR